MKNIAPTCMMKLSLKILHTSLSINLQKPKLNKKLYFNPKKFCIHVIEDTVERVPRSTGLDDKKVSY